MKRAFSLLLAAVLATQIGTLTAGRKGVALLSAYYTVARKSPPLRHRTLNHSQKQSFLPDAYAFIPRQSIYKPLPSSSANTCQWTMKIFDWKRREADESAINDVENYEFTLDNLKPAPGSRHRKKRKGRGISAGQGASCGFGMRGQKSRSGRPTRPGFEGGQNPLYRRLPKFVGRPMGPGHTKTLYNIIPTTALSQVEEGATVNFDSLLDSKIITKSKYKIHKIVMGREEAALPSGLTVQAHAFTKSAQAAIEAAGGSCQLLSKTTHTPVEA